MFHNMDAWRKETDHTSKKQKYCRNKPCVYRQADAGDICMLECFPVNKKILIQSVMSMNELWLDKRLEWHICSKHFLLSKHHTYIRFSICKKIVLCFPEPLELK